MIIIARACRSYRRTGGRSVYIQALREQEEGVRAEEGVVWAMKQRR